MKPPENIKKLIKNIEIDTNAKMDRVVLADVLKALENSKETKSTKFGPNIGRIIMKSRITKFAAAAVIIVAIASVTYKFSWTLDGASVAWAEVIEKIKTINDIEAESWRKFTVLGKNTPLFEGKVLKYFSRGLGYVEEQYIGEKCVFRGCGLFPEKKGVLIWPDQKKYFEFDLNEEVLLLAEKLNPLDPTGMLEIFDKVQYQRLGFSEIDEIKIEVFEVSAFEIRKNKISDNFLLNHLLPMETLTVRFWVDVQTSLPRKIEAEGIIGKGFLTLFNRVVANELIYDIKWGEKMDPNIFEPNVPEDYNVMPRDYLKVKDENFDVK